MLEMTQKLVLRCNSLAYNQISNQNLAISNNIWAVNWHFMSKFCPKITENTKKNCNFFSAKFPTSFSIFTILVRNFVCGFLMVFRKKYSAWIFYFRIFGHFMGRQKRKINILGDFGDFLCVQVRVKSGKMKN